MTEGRETRRCGLIRCAEGTGTRGILNEGELDVLRLIGQARSNREIAEELFLSGDSVKSRIRKAYRKIGVHSRTEALHWAIHHELAEHSDDAATSRQTTPDR